MTEQELRALVVRTARAYIGSGAGNGGKREIIDRYNAHQPLAQGYRVRYTDAWCAAFVSAVAIACALTDVMPTECSCPRMLALYQARGRWEEDDAYRPRPGDLVLYDWQDSGAGDCTGAPDHVGIVAGVENGWLEIVEGNLGDAVGTRRLAVNGRYIRGYCLPDYAARATKEETNMIRYQTMEEIPAALRRETQALLDAGALRGRGGGLDVTEDMLRCVIVSKRYADALAER